MSDTGFPGTNAPLLDANGNITPIWFRFFLSLWNRTGASQVDRTPGSVTVGSSPFDYVAKQDGTLFISGGGVSGVTLSRKGQIAPVGSHYAPIPMTAGDTVTLTFSATPTVWFVPV